MRVEDYLKEDKIEECKEYWYAALQNYFSYCNSYWLYVQRLEEFDYDLFNISGHNHFLRTTKFAHFEMFIIRFSSLVTDIDRKTKKGEQPEILYTLPNLYRFLQENAKNQQIRNKFVKKFEKIGKEIHEKLLEESPIHRQIRDEFIKNLEEKEKNKKEEDKTKHKTGFEYWVKEIAYRLAPLRNKFTAHLDSEYLNQKTDKSKIRQLNSKEIREMLDTAQEYFNAMTFDSYYTLWFWGYNENARSRYKTDIDKLLDLIAMNSPIIARSQDHPEIWGIHRPGLSDAQIAKINEVRRKMGLPDVE